MKTKPIINSVILFLFMICCVVISTNAELLNAKKTKTRLKAYYEKLADGNKKILIILNRGSGKSMAGVKNAEIFLATVENDSLIDLTSLYTDKNGEAIFIIEQGYTFPKDEDGFTIIKFWYNGDDSLKAAKKKIKFKELNLAISLDVIDSVKQVTVTAYELDSMGNKMPAEKVELNIGVERLYSTFFIDKVKTNKQGIGTMDFPDDIPGDSVGLITIIVKIDDDNDFGTVFKSETKKWGTIVDYSDRSHGRSLFGDSAPLWMIISVAVILFGAWYHFILAIVKVYKISKIDQEPI